MAADHKKEQYQETLELSFFYQTIPPWAPDLEFYKL
jgi:hypothetical protein